MNFEELLALTAGQPLESFTIYSVEKRSMLNHDTDIEYYQDRATALRRAEAIWTELTPEDQNYHEISVHLGELELQPGMEQPHFLVHKKLFKAYKKIYVTVDFANSFIDQQKAKLLTEQLLDEETAVQEAKNLFNAQYAIQPQIAYGMFAGYDYTPIDR